MVVKPKTSAHNIAHLEIDALWVNFSLPDFTLSILVAHRRAGPRVECGSSEVVWGKSW